MSKLEETWGRERLVASAYDLAVQNRWIGRAAALALWGFDIRKLFASIDKIRSAAPGTRVLDVPCGGGLVFNALDRNHGLDYTALDYSPVMLERAGRRMEVLGLDAIRFRQGDVGALPFADAAFDLCLTYNGIHCFPDPPLAIAELVRVLRPGGILRGTLIVGDAGLRYNALISLFQHRGSFGPGCTRHDLLDWLVSNGMRVIAEELSGGMLLFEAEKAL